MNINGLGNTTPIDALSALGSASNSDVSAALEAASTPAASTTVSKPGELLNKLSQLLQQDPGKFKAVTQQISDELKTAAQGTSGPGASFLSKLSDNFAQASGSGSLSALEPPEGSGGRVSGHHHHAGGHHGGGQGGGIEAVVSTALDRVNQALSGTSSGATTPQ